MKVEKEFTLDEIKKIGDLVLALFECPLTAAQRYHLDGWATPFLEKHKLIEKQREKIIRSFLQENENTPTGERLAPCMEAVTKFLEEKDTVEVSIFKLEWIANVASPNTVILHKFMKPEYFA